MSDAGPLDVIWFDDARKDLVQAYLDRGEGLKCRHLESTAALIDGFESPFGIELLATAAWLLTREGVREWP